MFQRNILVTHLSRQLRGFLQHFIGLIGQIGRTTRNLRVSIHDPIQRRQNISAINTQLIKNEVRDIFTFLDHASQQMSRLDGLLTFFLCKLHGCLNSLLRLNCIIVHVHSLIFSFLLPKITKYIPKLLSKSFILKSGKAF